jgi:hypothetical protein
MRPIILPVPLIGVLLRVEIVPIGRRPAKDAGTRIAREAALSALQRELSPRLLRDIGLDNSRSE